MSEILVNTIKKADGTGSITVPAETGTVLTSASSINSVPGAIRNAESWRLTADFTTNDAVVTGWEVVDESTTGSIGTGLTESSGVFSFPTTGTWLINGSIRGICASGDNGVSITLGVSSDGGSSFPTYTIATVGAGGNSASGTMPVHAIINADNTSNVKFRWFASSLSTGSNIAGNTDQGESHFYVIRLGDAA